MYSLVIHALNFYNVRLSGRSNEMDRSPAKHVEDNTLLTNILNQNVDLDDFDLGDFEEPEDPHAQDVEAQRRA
jgi:hypothetical protein